MKRSKLFSNLNGLFYIFSYFILIEPRWFYYVHGISDLFQYSSLFLCGISLILYLYNYKNARSIIVDLVILYHIYLIINTVLNHGAVATAVNDSAKFVGLSVVTCLVLKDQPELLYTKLYKLLCVEVIVNFFTIVLLPDGLYATSYFRHNYFLGYDNQMINIFIPTLFFAFIYKEINTPNSKKYFAIISIIIVFSVIRVWSGASLVIVFLIMTMLLMKLSDKTDIFNMRNYLLVNVSLFFLLVVVKAQQIFSFLIENILKRDLTMTGRVYIWDRALYFFYKNPIWGYGIEDQAYRADKMGLDLYYSVPSRLASFTGLHAHDRFLETAYRGGIILLTIYFAILIIASKKLTINKEMRSAKILSVVLFAYLTGMLTEFYRLSYMFFPLMVIAENIEKLNTSLISYKNQMKINGSSIK